MTCWKAPCLEVRRANHTTCLPHPPPPPNPLSKALDGFSKIKLYLGRWMNTVTRVHYKLVVGKLRYGDLPCGTNMLSRIV